MLMLTNRNIGMIMYLTLSEAAKLAQVSRATLYKRNKEGKLSFHTNEMGKQVINMAELSRLYTLQTDTVTNHNTPKEDNLGQELWQVKLDAAQEKITLLEQHISNLQSTLQHEQSHVTKLLNTSEKLMLTHDQRPKTFLKKIREILSFN